MKIDSEHLEILAVIVDKGGLTEAATALGKSQPSVSRSMALLEQRIGMPLFESRRRPLRPTKLGVDLARLGSRIRIANQEASLMIQRFRQGHAGNLRIGGTPIFMDGAVSTIFADFQSRYADVNIEQFYGYQDTLIADLRNDALDMAVLPLHPSQVPADLEFTPLLSGLNVITCRVGHPLTRRKAITLADIEPFTWIAPPANSPLYRDLERALKSIGCEDFRVNFSGGTLASIQAMLAGSDSLTVLPYSVVFLSRQTVPLEALPLKINHPNRELGFLVSKDRPGLPAIGKLADFLKAEFQLLQTRIEHEQQVTRRRG
ncbi:DNA-binding transcriptional regulator, LysR family [Lutimaribacter pacificus]|uniref:DNA-binding transcriptional regulator, LysR family n=2 Tax=Pseudomonadota TaxID=1224 RepID=A0A1H0L7X0_9RHOB|nr:LysR family transcriptional regulator [Lutimaribacter pacificus]SDO64136.1 DNA-binding transcriptional regulator, LysR family [Lutimaribacter pacificus]SHK70235.1 DNA-binding transcriptional regulator, LysR family [Lutimaribacter pacificus]